MKYFSNSNELRSKFEHGIKTVSDTVASTLGPKGRTVVIHQKDKMPFATKDGVTVAKFIDLEDPIENTGAQIVKQAAEKTNQEAGDGTTTTTVLTYAMYKEAQKYLASGAPPIELKKGMELAGKDGSVTIEDARSVETSLDLVEGFRFDSGYLATAFINDDQRAMVKYENPLVMVTDEKIEAVEEMLPALEIASREGRPFVIVAENIEGQALAALIMNAMRGTMRVVGIKAPRYGEERRNILKDLATSIGATLISREMGVTLKDVKLTHFGEVKKVEVSKNLTTLMGGNGDQELIEKEIDKLKAMMQDTGSMTECEKIQERITRLASGVSVIRVGGATEIEMIEKRHRIEDSLEAVKAAQLEGILPGGSTFLTKQSKGLSSVKSDNEWQRLGVKIVQQAINEPLRQMAKNAGESPDIILKRVAKGKDNFGYDFKENKFVNFYDAGIVDPARVTRCALQNAVSVASTLISSNYAIVEK